MLYLKLTLLKKSSIRKFNQYHVLYVVPCQNLAVLSGGTQIGSQFRYEFQCNNGFSKKGPSVINCVNGAWNDNPPRCFRLECGSPLGLESGKIRDKNMRASSNWYWYDAKYGRLNGRDAWCSGLGDSKLYLEIDLGKPYNITYLATQGGKRKWVSNYLLSHSLARSYFIEYRESSRKKLFTGNTDETSIVKYKLKKPLIARKIRFLPLFLPLYGRAFNRACMRVEIYGCDLPNFCVMVGSRVLGRWVNYYRGGYIYYKAIVRTIGSNKVQLEIEDENHDNDSFKSMPKANLVLDVPNKQFNLPKGTRVLLADRNNKYFTGTIYSRMQDFYQVYPDSRRRSKWVKKNEVRVLKPEQFCE